MNSAQDPVDVAYTLIRDPKTDRLLIVGHHDGGWSLPGGTREVGETLAAAAIRETLEEAGVRVAIQQLVSVNERFPNPHATFFVFTAHITEGESALTGDAEISSVRWVTFAEAQQLMPYLPFELQTLTQRQGAAYHASSWDNQTE